MSVYAEMFNNYKEIRERLKAPSNAVKDTGIDLRRHLIPVEPEQKKVLEPPPPVVIHMSFHIRYTKPNLGMIERAVLRHFLIAAKDLHGERRTQDLVYPRQIFFYLCRIVGGHSFPRIGHRGSEYRRLFRKRDHTTVMHGYRKISGLIERKNERVIADIEAISSSLRWVIETPTTSSSPQEETPTANSEVANVSEL